MAPSSLITRTWETNIDRKGQGSIKYKENPPDNIQHSETLTHNFYHAPWKRIFSVPKCEIPKIFKSVFKKKNPLEYLSI